MPIMVDYIYGCDTCDVTEVSETEGGVGYRPPDPLSLLPRGWRVLDDGHILCAACNPGRAPREEARASV